METSGLMKWGAERGSARFEEQRGFGGRLGICGDGSNGIY
jgi:hypothetical protein